VNHLRSAAAFAAANDRRKEAASVCVWHMPPEFENEDAVFVTACGHTVELGENESDEIYRYCPFCGKRICWDHMRRR